jgi:hypothetical protein
MSIRAIQLFRDEFFSDMTDNRYYLSRSLSEMENNFFSENWKHFDSISGAGKHIGILAKHIGPICYCMPGKNIDLKAIHILVWAMTRPA